MEDPSGDAEPSHFCSPHSQREYSALFLEWATARTETDKKHLLDMAGVTPEEPTEYFGTGSLGDLGNQAA